MGSPVVSKGSAKPRRGLGAPLGAALARIRIVVSAAHDLTRLGLAAMAGGRSDMTVVAEVEDAASLRAVFTRERPDLVIVDFDVRLHRDAAVALVAAVPGAIVLAIGTHEGDEEIRRALEAGMRGYLPKSLSAREIAGGVRRALERKVSLPVSVMQTLTERAGEPKLTLRQREVLDLLAEGRNNASIAAALEIATGTVKVHVKAILGKLGAADRTEATAIAFRRGFVRLQ
jgi:DNA-binding NarL/FixJ family response regulator